MRESSCPLHLRRFTSPAQEGFTPATFRSSRSERHKSTTQSVNDFLDEDERAEQGVLQVQCSALAC